MKKISIVAVYLSVATMVSIAAPPTIVEFGPIEHLGANHFRGSIATDSANQPHIVTTSGTIANFYDKIGATWRVDSMSSAATFNSSQYGNPRVEIAGNNAWYSGVLWGGSFGFGIILRQNIASAPSLVSSSPKVRARPSPGTWDAGTHAVDPAFPNTAIVSSMAGFYVPVTFNGVGLSVGLRGQMFAGQGGEKNAFWISKAGSVPHVGGNRAVWHGAIGGYPAYSSAYRNSLMPAPVTFAANGAYPAQGDDGQYVNVVSDNLNPAVGYMVASYKGIIMNIWDGTKMLFSVNNNLVIDPNGGVTDRRYAPRLAPAKNGGVFVMWRRGGLLLLRYVGPDGVMGDVINLGAGAPGDLCVDSKGNIHIFYISNGAKYRKLTVSSSSPTNPGDFDGDGLDDLATYNDITRRWHIRKSSNQVLLNNETFGVANAVPVVGRFLSTNVSTLGYVVPQTARWTVRNTFTNSSLLLNNVAFGPANGIPLVGDFNNDGIDDMASVNPQTFVWQARTVGGNSLFNNIQHGGAGMVPVVGDFDGDGQSDLGVYNPGNSRWYVRRVNGTVITWGQQWGYAGVSPMARDMNGDGKDDLVLYDSRTMRWYALDAQSGSVIVSGRKYGASNSTPAPGKYVENGGSPKANLTTFTPSNGRWSVLSNDGESLQPGLAAAANGIPVPGNYFNNGLTKAIFEPNGGNWRIQNGNDIVTIQWGGPGMIPVVGDYNNDGVTDLAVYSAGRWYIRTVAGQVLAWGLQHGFPGAVPVAGDYNNNGRSDLAVYHEATGRWYIRGIGGIIIGWNIQHGFPGAQAVSGDFNGDGAYDLAVWNRQAGRWYIRSIGGQIIGDWGKQHGYAGASVVSGDYDGDNKHDLIVYDRNSFKWYILPATGGASLEWNASWGKQDAVPVIFDNKLAVMQQDRTWYVRENVNDILDVVINSGQINATPIGAGGL